MNPKFGVWMHENRGGSRISGKGVHMYKGVCVGGGGGGSLY